jgi:hypothetical protein
VKSLKKKNGVKNLIKGGIEKIMPISVELYPKSCNIFGKNITQTPMMEK